MWLPRKDHLNDDGLMMMNINMWSDKKGSISYALCDTAYGVFDNLYCLKTAGGSGAEVFATKNKEVNFIDQVKGVLVEDQELQNVFNKIKYNLTVYEDTGIRLYDDTADVEMRSIWALDELIQDELEYYRQILKEEGIRGLLDQLFE